MEKTNLVELITKEYYKRVYNYPVKKETKGEKTK